MKSDQEQVVPCLPPAYSIPVHGELCVRKLTRVVQQGTKQETLYNIDMYWVGCAEEDIITLVSDGLHHNLGTSGDPSEAGYL